MNSQEPISRRQLLIRAATSPVGRIFAFLFAAGVIYFLWEHRIGIVAGASIAAILFFIVSLYGVIPFTLGFSAQFLVRRPLPSFIQTLISAALSVGIWLTEDGSPKLTNVGMILVSIFLRFVLIGAFIEMGAWFHRRLLSSRFSRPPHHTSPNNG